MSRLPLSPAFTFIELLIVLIVIGVFIALAIPQIGKAYDGFLLDDAVKDVYYIARYLQESAITKGLPHRLAIAIDKEKCTLSGFARNGTVDIPIEGRINKVYTVPEALTFSVEFDNQPEAKNDVFFYPDGSSDTARLRFQNKHQRQAAVCINGTQGEITIE